HGSCRCPSGVKAPSDTASRVRFALTPAVLSIDLSRSAVPTHSSPAVVSTEPALDSQLHEVQHEIQNIDVRCRDELIRCVGGPIATCCTALHRDRHRHA